MKVKEKKIGDRTVRLSATATAAEVNSAFDDIERGFANKLGLMPDPSKTAAQAIEEKLQIESADAALASQVADELVPYAIDAKHLMPTGAPRPVYDAEPQRDRPFAFRIDVTLKPHYELTSYNPVEVHVAPFEFDERLVEQQLKQVTHQYPEFLPDDPHPVGEHDICSISLEAEKDGERIEGLSTKRRTLSLGEGFMPEDFERQVVGMNVGETREFTFQAPSWDPDKTEPEVYSAKVTVLEIQKEVLPELTDEWVAGHMPMYGDVEQLRKSIRTDLVRQARHQYDLQVTSIAQTELAQRFEGEVDDAVYESTAANIKNALVMQLQQQGKTLDEFIEEQGGEQAFNLGLMMQARQTILCDFALDALFDHENIEVTEADIMDACSELNPQNPMGVRQHMEQKGRGFALREISQRYAASRYLVDHAKIVNDEPAEDEAQDGRDADGAGAAAASPAAGE